MPAHAGQAGGMTMVESGVLAFGWGDSLIRMELGAGWPDSTFSLADFGVSRVEALAVDRHADALLIIDADGRLLSLPRSVVPWL